jgi:hypothetical protein
MNIKTRRAKSDVTGTSPVSVPMQGMLIRVGIDQTFGGWNAPVDTDTNEFVFVPIPEIPDGQRPKLVHKYEEVAAPLKRYDIDLPPETRRMPMHLDPDFSTLTYGDCGRKAKQVCKLGSGDVIAFYAGMRSASSGPGKLVHALIGLFIVDEIVNALDVPRSRWHENAHTRRKRDDDNIIVRAKPGVSGRLTRCIPIGEFRDRAYRVKRDILRAWGGLTVHDGYITRSAQIPRFNDAARFYSWFRKQRVPLVRSNNP